MEDIDALAALWTTMGYRSDELAKKITEFQVVETGDGKLIGAAGFEIIEKQGRIHSEGFVDFALADHARPFLWDRFQVLGQNYSLLGLWTQEQAPYWAHSGLGPASPEALAGLPKPWRHMPGRWLTLKLRDNVEAILAAEGQFELFMQQEKARTARTYQHAKALKILATLLAFAVLVAVLVGAFYLIRRNPDFRPP